ncbi:MATE family efflux transporter [Sphingomonas sp. Leaf357]|uniref:MATE family efflux transporter n=1 Tax=Sphingomonas sp. Leaf357 TaxID=1736350 RepID=UPI0006F78BAF|nr:MATE family efflux transporter [Sphingomonas sp. Leaf357]KQS02910.1 MATE family efflux transporter [Sphingomonas sp. Leaf357]
MDAPIAIPALTGPPPTTAGDELRALLRLAIPLAAANLLQMAVYAIDVIFVARLGPVELAAATLGVYLYSVAMWALSGLVGACAPVIAAELGARRHAVRQVRRSFRMAMWLAVLATLPFVALLSQGERLMLLAGQDPVVAARAGTFLHILLFAMIPAVASAAMRVTASALGRPGWATAITAMALAVNLLGNWLLVFGHGGFPALGLEGSAISSVVTSVAMMLAYALILVLDPKIRRYRLFGNWWRSEWSRLREIVKLGIPIALIFTLEGALFSTAGFLMGLIGVEQVGAHALALQIAAIAFQVPFGVAQAATIRVGMAYGAADHRWIARAGWVALGVGIGFMGVTASLLWAFPRLALGLYIDVNAPANAPLVALALQYLVIAALFQLFDGGQTVAAGVLRGLQDTRMPMVIAAFGYWVVGFGACIGLGFGLHWQGVGIWIGLAIGLAVVSALLVWRWSMRARLGLLPAPAVRSLGEPVIFDR